MRTTTDGHMTTKPNGIRLTVTWPQIPTASDWRSHDHRAQRHQTDGRMTTKPNGIRLTVTWPQSPTASDWRSYDHKAQWHQTDGHMITKPNWRSHTQVKIPGHKPNTRLTVNLHHKISHLIWCSESVSLFIYLLLAIVLTWSISWRKGNLEIRRFMP